MATTNAAQAPAGSDLGEDELMAMDLIDCGWEAGAIEDAFGREPGWVSEAMEKAAAEAQRAGLH